MPHDQPYAVNERDYMQEGDITFTGVQDFVFCSQDVNEAKEYEKNQDEVQVFVIKDKEINAKNLEFRLVYKRESVYLISQPFDYQYSNSVFIKLQEGEEYPLHPSSVIQIGTKIQFLVEKYNTGIIAAPGRRGNMEDSFVIIQDLRIHPLLTVSIYGVLDGHGGDWCAIFIRERFEDEMRKNLLDVKDGIYGVERESLNQCISKALCKTFHNIDEDFFEERCLNSIGSTASIVVIVGKHIFCANVGDSRAVLSRQGTAVNLSLDHKAESKNDVPSRPDEVARIEKAGGQIKLGRVEGKLAITRAFGDFEFKNILNDKGLVERKDFITSNPEIRRYDYNPFQDEFILIASDGLFDRFTSQEAVDFIRENIKKKRVTSKDVDILARQIAYESIYLRGGRDNTTVMLLALNRDLICSEEQAHEAVAPKS